MDINSAFEFSETQMFFKILFLINGVNHVFLPWLKQS